MAQAVPLRAKRGNGRKKQLSVTFLTTWQIMRVMSVASVRDINYSLLTFLMPVETSRRRRGGGGGMITEGAAQNSSTGGKCGLL